MEPSYSDRPDVSGRTAFVPPGPRGLTPNEVAYSGGIARDSDIRRAEAIPTTPHILGMLHDALNIVSNISGALRPMETALAVDVRDFDIAADEPATAPAQLYTLLDRLNDIATRVNAIARTVHG